MAEHRDDSGMNMEEYADLQASLPALNVRAGMARAMGRRDTYLQLLDKFRCRFTDFATLMQDLFSAQDKEAAIIHAHSLKGIAASLGAEELRGAARELEQQLRRGQAPAALARVEHLLDEILQQIEGLDWSRAAEKPPSAAENNTPEDTQHWSRCLEQLLVPLQKLQVNKVKALLHELQGQNLTPTQSEQLEHLEQMLQGYRYKQAAEYIEGLL
ncbi:MAG: Hpt domain-containing protein [Geobacteraceae bacterium]|nr:Hpt domain-containing protein [Geobacteraceae bacterium]